MRKLFLILCSVGVITSLKAQYDPNAKKLLDQVSKNAESWKSVKVEFKITLITVEPKTEEVHSGTLWQKGSKYKLSLMETETYSNGEKKWVYMPEAEEVSVFNIKNDSPKGLLDNPQQLFKIYTKGYKYILGNEEKINGKPLQIVELVPEANNVEFFKIKVWIDRNEKRIEQLMYFAKDGGRILVEVKSYTFNPSLPDSMFEFDLKAHPKVNIIDMTD
ncbi:MAG TPA: outer membrane lipoprotein carrier protein LolA [Salinivirgaceae bacterium]|nr:outer membrane lipoprotein carrier protein LolA [Salinivirgaceae bacterium]